MKKIKITGAFILILLTILTLIFNQTDRRDSQNSMILFALNQQKEFTQDISKNIFYLSKNRNSDLQNLNNSIKSFLSNMQSNTAYLQTDKEITHLWNQFYLHVEMFRKNINSTSPYSNILVQQSVKDIYATNLKLILEFDKLIKSKKNQFEKEQGMYKILQYSLFFILFALLLYLFLELNSVINFMQKFITLSKNIINDSNIKKLKIIESSSVNIEATEAKNNFNMLVSQIDESIKNSSDSLQDSRQSLLIVEQNIEKFMELIYAMDENPRDDELIQKEDAIIQALEELSKSAKELENLKISLSELLTCSPRI